MPKSTLATSTIKRLSSSYVAVPLNTSLFTLYTSTKPTRCYKYGDVFMLTGMVKPVSDISNGGNGAVIGTIPTGYRPLTDCFFVCQASGMNKWCCKVSSSTGEIMVERYGVTDYATIPAGAWMPFDVTYII